MLLYQLLLASLLAIASVVSSSPQGPGGPTASFSPIRELGPSLAASVAGGTIIAARSPSLPNKGGDDACNNNDDDDDCLVVLFRSTINGNSRTKKSGDIGNLTVTSVFGCADDNDTTQSPTDDSSNAQNNYYHGLSFLPNGPVNFPFLSTSNGSGSGSNNNNLRILNAQSGLLVAATGFAPDAEHILNVAAGRVFSRISVFDAPSSYSSSQYNGGSCGKSVDPHRLVREDLSSLMIDAAMSDGGRPLGVQLLVIGQSALPQKGSGSVLELYTIDPSGGWRSCVGKGTAVGRGAERVRSSFMDESQLSSSKATSSFKSKAEQPGWKGALDRALMAAIDALEKDEDTDDTADQDNDGARPNANYGAVAIFGRSNWLQSQQTSSRCAAINPDVIKDCYNRCCERVSDQRLAKL